MKGLMDLLRQHGVRFTPQLPVRHHNTFRIGGTVALAVFPEGREQLLAALAATRERGVPYAVVGKGSNLLFPDTEYGGAVIFTGGVAECRREENTFYADAGTPLAALAIRARNASLSGAEFMGGIPGTLGGAVITNAGAFGSSMQDLVVATEYWDGETGRIERLEGNANGFGYRTSFYSTRPHLTVLSAELRLMEGNAAEIDRIMKQYHEKRRATQPLELPNAGSIFKHPKGHYAGKLIEDCGLKGYRVGDAAVSEKHAGFIVNRGNATAEDVRELIRLIRARVEAACGIRLECELKGLGLELDQP